MADATLADQAQRGAERNRCETALACSAGSFEIESPRGTEEVEAGAHQPGVAAVAPAVALETVVVVVVVAAAEEEDVAALDTALGAAASSVAWSGPTALLPVGFSRWPSAEQALRLQWGRYLRRAGAGRASELLRRSFLHLQPRPGEHYC